jgi:hypothetical protein
MEISPCSQLPVVDLQMVAYTLRGHEVPYSLRALHPESEIMTVGNVRQEIVN